MKLAILGAGNIAKVHAQTVAAHPHIEFAGVADAVPQAAEALAEQYGTQVLDSEALFTDKDIDAVLIASSTATHADFLEKAAEHGKAVLCEKPVALDLERTRRAVTTVQRTSIVCGLGFNRRHDPQYQELKKRLVEGHIGNLETLMIISRDPAPPPVAYIKGSGGLFRDMTIHDFDMARWLLADPIREVHATGSALVNKEIGAAGDIDTAMITLVSEQGRLCHISNSRRAAYGYDQRIEAFGSEGMLRAQNEGETPLLLMREEGELSAPPKHFYLERYMTAYRRELDDFYMAWKEQRDPLATAEDGYQAQRLAEAASRSLHSGQPVRLSDIN
ncbi:inositol 2-dehydrogenase [Carnimonas nigrificans]|uniref:inositol 2-dehydrogenase n=1 Tax=Carnimonas nigrificans TaxID=64323 RepID=UPI00046F6C3E|nr:inositol 2-dehydrogenase [Carnimonas nigrificans]